MALEQFTEKFVANLPITNRQTLKDFYGTMFRTPAADRIHFIAETIDQQKGSLPNFEWHHEKDDIKSEHFRTTGNECFVRLEFIEALVSPHSSCTNIKNIKLQCFDIYLQKYYNKALVFAVSQENLSICYANRSAVYYELSLFDLCLENIQLATKYKLPEYLKVKLDQRQEAAVTHLLSKLVVKPKCTYDMRMCRPTIARQPFFINCLSQKSNQIFTNEPLLAGDVISLERPYSQILRQSHIYERCTYCLTNKKYLSMIPCKRCTSAMFCSQFCYLCFHSIECPIIDGLYYLLPEFMYLGLRTVLVTLTECGTTDEYRKLLLRCFSNGAESFDINTTTTNRTFQEMVFLIIHNLNRSWSFSLQHHLATAVLMEQLKLNSKPILDIDRNLEELLSTSIFHMIQVSMENSVLLEETALTSNCVDDDVTIYGCGLFPFASNFNFSCAPNVLFVNCSGIFSGIVIRPIKAGESILPSIM